MNLGAVRAFVVGRRNVMSGIMVSVMGPDSLDYVLVDDDPLIRRGWEIAARESGIKLKTFSSGKEALAAPLPLDAKLCFDLKLGQGESGIALAKTFFERGHRFIFLTTGMPPQFVAKPDWICGVLEKDPPWIAGSDETPPGSPQN